MNSDHARHEPRTAVPPILLANQRADLWCGPCKAYSAFTADVVTLNPGGVTVVGSVTGCQICDDPDDPEVNRGSRGTAAPSR